jgi:hypothetical protein
VLPQERCAGVGQRLGGLGLADRQRPVAGEDHLDGGVRVRLAHTERERVDVEQHGRDRLGGDEAETEFQRRDHASDTLTFRNAASSYGWAIEVADRT